MASAAKSFSGFDINNYSELLGSSSTGTAAKQHGFQLSER